MSAKRYAATLPDQRDKAGQCSCSYAVYNRFRTSGCNRWLYCPSNGAHWMIQRQSRAASSRQLNRSDDRLRPLCGAPRQHPESRHTGRDQGLAVRTRFGDGSETGQTYSAGITTGLESTPLAGISNSRRDSGFKRFAWLNQRPVK